MAVAGVADLGRDRGFSFARQPRIVPAATGIGMSVTVETHGRGQRPPAPVARVGSKAIPSLDGIRAVSILIVFLSHAGLSRIMPASFGVSLFFSSPVT
jgi:hypothetical protein